MAASSSRDDILRRLSDARASLREEFEVASFALFGSVARDEARDDSDIDVLVTFRQPIGLVAFGALEQRLADLLGGRVDLVEPDALHPALRDRILREALER
ncbi:MAG: nucleotidyltransferase family protein [Alphaproteobacteria bacterium]|nr:nucleotidyltransferase family protein [Alphaproteobacteria bacterium]